MCEINHYMCEINPLMSAYTISAIVSMTIQTVQVSNIKILMFITETPFESIFVIFIYKWIYISQLILILKCNAYVIP